MPPFATARSMSPAISWSDDNFSFDPETPTAMSGTSARIPGKPATTSKEAPAKESTMTGKTVPMLSESDDDVPLHNTMMQPCTTSPQAAGRPSATTKKASTKASTITGKSALTPSVCSTSSSTKSLSKSSTTASISAPLPKAATAARSFVGQYFKRTTASASSLAKPATKPISTSTKAPNKPATASTTASNSVSDNQLQTFAIRKHYTYLHIKKLALEYIKDRNGQGYDDYETEGEMTALIGTCQWAIKELSDVPAIAGSIGQVSFHVINQIALSSIMLGGCFAYAVDEEGYPTITDKWVERHLEGIKEKLKACADGVDVYGPL